MRVLLGSAVLLGPGLARAGVVRTLLALVASGPCAYRHVPHIHSSLAIAARAEAGTGPPLP